MSLIAVFRRCVIAYVFIAASCAVGPFVPPHAQPCSWEGACPKHTQCRFPKAGSAAVCMPGENDLDNP